VTRARRKKNYLVISHHAILGISEIARDTELDTNGERYACYDRREAGCDMQKSTGYHVNSASHADRENKLREDPSLHTTLQERMGTDARIQRYVSLSLFCVFREDIGSSYVALG